MGSFAIDGRVCQYVPSGKTFACISRRTDNLPLVSKAHTTLEPTAISFR